MEKQKNRRRFHAAAILFLILAILAFYYETFYRRSELAVRNGAEKALSAQISLLQEALKKQGIAPGLGAEDILALRKQGLKNPVEDIKADLLSRPDLIPQKGVAGGTMGFHSAENIYVLSPRWVLASFEDGHITGKMLLEYSVQGPAKISWKVLSSYLE